MNRAQQNASPEQQPVAVRAPRREVLIAVVNPLVADALRVHA